MKKIKILLLFFLFVIGTSQAQSILGKWRTIDKNGVSKCIVNIYEKDGKVYGKMVEVLVEEEKNALCAKCEGDQKNKHFTS